MSEALDIRPVTREEFLALPHLYPSRTVLGQENMAVRKLAVGEAISLPCRWKHRPTCGSHSLVRGYAQRHPPLCVAIHCHQGRVYVLRLEDRKG